jgi:UDP:flavonoid glycosyltransferase YjiC (YdhE family)
VRILFTFFGTRPHLYPLVPLAWAFRAAGHDVRLASTPMWASDMAYSGLPTVTVGGSPKVTSLARGELADTMFTQQSWPTDWAARMDRLDRGRLAYLESIGRYLVAAAAAVVDELVVFARDWAPDVVVYDSFSYAGPATAAALGIPAVRHLSGTDSAQRLEFVQPGPEPLPEYIALFERFAVDVQTEPQATVDPTPPSLRLVTPPDLLGMRYIPYNGPGTTPDGLIGQRPRPRVCVTWGHTISAVGGDGTRPFREAIDAIAALGMDCLVATSAVEVERLGPLPPSARALASVPLHLVLPYCDAIVHQGGDGTALTAATAAIPQLVIAASPEADMCGGRIANADAGMYLRDPDLRADPASPTVIRTAVAELLSNSTYEDGAARLHEEINSQPTPAEVVQTLVSTTLAPVGG